MSKTAAALPPVDAKRPPKVSVPRSLLPLHAAFFGYPTKSWTYYQPTHGGHIAKCLAYTPTSAVIIRDGLSLFFRYGRETKPVPLTPMSLSHWPKAFPLTFALPDIPFPPSTERCRFAFIPPLLEYADHGQPLVLFLRQFFAACCLSLSVRRIAEPFNGAICVVDGKPLFPGIPYIFASKHEYAEPIE